MAWSEVELPILRAVVQLEGTRGTSLDEVIEATGLERDAAARAIHRLMMADYLAASDWGDTSGPDWGSIRMLERGLRQVGEWPAEADLLRSLVAALSDTAETVDDPEERTRLQRAGAALGGLSRDVAVGVVTNLTARGLAGM